MVYSEVYWRSEAGALSPEAAEALCQQLDCGHAVEPINRAVTHQSVVPHTNWMCSLTKPNMTQCVETVRRPDPEGRSLRCAGEPRLSVRQVHTALTAFQPTERSPSAWT
ncbi:hypothetical protein chiPu_0033500 [Chiloscyllium punctatum]|uniref:SRCR domain-containing protein n=1 Tax=Chiloscyllium punctatum TaxID=137246 RepID=A0A401U2Z2_CHIPU|nr:hypothetical protein [Chiloscyllium punctatum]